MGLGRVVRDQAPFGVKWAKMGKKILYLLTPVFFIFILLSFFYLKDRYQHSKQVNASSSSISVNAKTDWDLGSFTNTKSSEPGSIELDNLVASGLDLSTKTTTDSKAVDGNYATSWSAEGTPPEVLSWKVDIGESAQIDKVKIYYSAAGGLSVNYSDNDINYTEAFFGGTSGSDPNGVYLEQVTDFSARYIRIDYTSIPVGPGLSMSEVFLYSDATGTHTTQTIDGGVDFWSWDQNTITQTVPANTSATYQYRTSANGTDWTSWVGSIGSVTNRTGDDSNNPTRYRYLQIKATLSNTDGVSTPQVDSYDIDYHTEVKPNAPSAQTATVQ